MLRTASLILASCLLFAMNAASATTAKVAIHMSGNVSSVTDDLNLDHLIGQSWSAYLEVDQTVDSGSCNSYTWCKNTPNVAGWVKLNSETVFFGAPFGTEASLNIQYDHDPYGYPSSDIFRFWSNINTVATPFSNLFTANGVSFSADLPNYNGNAFSSNLYNQYGLTADDIYFNLYGGGNVRLDAATYDAAYIASSVIPIPAAIWLFGSALAGLGWMRQKQAV